MFHHIVIYLAIVIICVSAGYGSEEIQSNPHIVHGRDANIRDHPYQVSLRLCEYHFCAGSIFSSKIILTAAHCMANVSIYLIKVVAGSTFLTEEIITKSVVDSLIHPNYNRTPNDYDVAILLLDTPLIFTDYVRPIELARWRPADGSTVGISGWGFKYENAGNTPRLQETFLKLVSNKFCGIMYRGYVTQRMLCAKGNEGKDACQNDSGGPLTYQNKLLGIVSFGLGCAREHPGVYVSVPDLYDWIYSTSKSMELKKNLEKYSETINIFKQNYCTQTELRK